SAPTLTGTKADHRLTRAPQEIVAFAKRLAAKLSIAVPGAPAPASADPEEAKWIDAIAEDLEKHQGASGVVAGDGQPPAVDILAHAMNFILNNFGKTVVHTLPVEEEGAHFDLEELAND